MLLDDVGYGLVNAMVCQIYTYILYTNTRYDLISRNETNKCDSRCTTTAYITHYRHPLIVPIKEKVVA